MLREWLWVRGDRVFSMVLILTAVKIAMIKY